MGTTAKGLRYPGPADLLADTPVYINQLRDDVAGKLAQVNYVVNAGVAVSTDASGFFTVPIPDFITLRGVCWTDWTGSDVWTLMPLITSIDAQSVRGQMFYMDRGATAGATPGTHALANGSFSVAFLAWGDPR